MKNPLVSIIVGCALAFVFFSPSASAGPERASLVSPPVQKSVLNVWPAGAMPGKAIAGPETRKELTDQNVLLLSNIAHPSLTFYLLPHTDSPQPVMIICPGGAYHVLAIDLEGTEIASWLNSIGIGAIILKYRVPDDREGALQDAQRAVSLVRAHAAAWKIDPKRIGMIGFSAGGNLAAKASTLFGQRAYSPIDDVDQVSCRPDYLVLVYPAYLEENGHVASYLNFKADIPPTLIIHNYDDHRFVRGSELYHAALDKAHVKNKLILYKTGGHGYGLRSKQAVRAWPKAAAKWLHAIGVR